MSRSRKKNDETTQRRARTRAALALAFKAVPGNTPDFYALQVLGAVLQSGQSSRLYQKLVKKKRWSLMLAVSWMRSARRALSTAPHSQTRSEARRREAESMLRSSA